MDRDKKSVALSAKIIGAVLLIGVPLTCFTRYDFNNSPNFPGVTLITNPDIKIESESRVGIFTSIVFK